MVERGRLCDRDSVVVIGRECDVEDGECDVLMKGETVCLC
jgi:hypothetical protein